MRPDPEWIGIRNGLLLTLMLAAVVYGIYSVVREFR